MHELSIAMSILDVAQEQAELRGGAHIEAIHVRIGDLSGVVAEALQSAYELACEHTAFANTRLIIERVPAVIYCATCGSEQQVASANWFTCPACRNVAAEVRGGRELEISALELAS